MHVRLTTACSLLFLVGVLVPEPPQTSPGQPEPIAVATSRSTVYIDRLPWLIVRPGRYELHGTLQMPEDPDPEKASGIVIRSDDVVVDLGGHALIGSKGSAAGILVKPPESRETSMLNITVRNGSVRNWGGHGVDLGSVIQARVEDLQLAGNGVARRAYHGLIVGEAAIVSRCSSQYNAAAGIRAGPGSQIVACTVSFNGGSGLLLDAGGIARSCVATGNTENGLVLTSSGGAALDCSASGNGRHGISAGPASRVSGCTTWGNKASGIRIEGHGLVQSCLSSGNSGAGIFVLSRGTRIDSNHLSGNGQGLDVVGRDHLVVRNSLTNNSVLWSLAEGSVSGGLHETMSLEQMILLFGSANLGETPDLEELIRRDPWTNFSK